MLLGACEAVIKGILESEVVVTRLVLTECEQTKPLIESLRQQGLRDVLRRHRLASKVVDDAGRAMDLAAWTAAEGRRVVVMLAGPTATASLPGVLSIEPFQQAEAMAIVLACPADGHQLRLRLAEAGVPMVEAGGVAELRDLIEPALRLSRGAARPCVVCVDESILESMASLEAHPNRAGDQPIAGLPRRRGPRWDEMGGPLRIARRLELNQSRSMPSPGERAPVAFVTVGAADRALRRLEFILDVVGRLPTLHLAVTAPIDEAAIERLLRRSAVVIVLEPGGRAVEGAIMRVAQQVRQTGEGAAEVWGRQLPGGDVLVSETHPSSLARAMATLLQSVVTGSPLSSRLVPDPPRVDVDCTRPLLGDDGHRAELVTLVQGLVAEDEEADREDEREAIAGDEPIQWLIDGARHGPGEGRLVVVEVWTETTLRRRGGAAMRQAAADGAAWLMLVAVGPPPAGVALERWIGGAVPSGGGASCRVKRRSGRAPLELLRTLREDARHPGLTVVLVEDDLPARFDVKSLANSVRDVDSVGYQRSRRIAWPADRACVIRQPSDLRHRDLVAVDEVIATRAAVDVSPVPLRWPPALGGRIRPLVEQVEVVRTSPPRRGRVGTMPPGQPEFLHASHPVWYAALAGVRGAAPGVAASVLAEAGNFMGYQVESSCNPTPIGPGRSASTAMVFSRPRDDEEAATVPPIIPWGEADLLLGYDRGEVVRAIDPQGRARVASPNKTTILCNTGLFEDAIDRGEDDQAIRKQLAEAVRRVGQPDRVVVGDVTGACRYRFHNERLADLVLLGMAWQSGAVPLSLDAMHRGLSVVEQEGWARLREAFDFGRSAWNDHDLLEPRASAEEESGRRSLRRYRLVLARTRVGGRESAGQFRRLAERVTGEMPGLLETAAGRASHRDFVLALRRCVTWGGFDLADRFADRVLALYRADRADRARALTRLAVLPLAEAMLIRDAVFIARMAISAEHRQSTRRRLNVSRARGDRISVRYLTRLEVTLVRWRIRLDLRTSDWMAVFLSSLRWVVPRGLRGRRSQRQVRSLVEDVVLQATSCKPEAYEEWERVLEVLHAMALDGRIRRVSPAALRRAIRKARQEA